MCRPCALDGVGKAVKLEVIEDFENVKTLCRGIFLLFATRGRAAEGALRQHVLFFKRWSKHSRRVGGELFSLIHSLTHPLTHSLSLSELQIALSEAVAVLLLVSFRPNFYLS